MKNHKPIVSYYKSGDPTKNFEWVPQLTDINIINTKNLSDEFNKIVIENKHRIFIHLNINGMGGTVLEPNIQSVKNTFIKLKQLINLGFPQKQILVVVNPILPNDNGLRALELLLKVFTQFKDLRLRYVRFNVLHYKSLDKGKYQESYITTKIKEKFVVANDNILKRPSTKNIMPYLVKTSTFFKDYYKLLKRYESIISIDNSLEPLIGVRELMCFGFNNSWKTDDEKIEKIIYYDNNNKFKPIVNTISRKLAYRCSNRCLLCPWKN